MNIIIITGASSGLGVEFALQLDNIFQKIDEIWLIARRKKEMLEVAQYLEHTTRILDMDVTDEKQMERLEKLLADEKPVIRMLVNCAGYGIMGAFSTSNIGEELGMIDVNCKALTRMTYLCIPYMQKNSRIIQLASSAAFLPQPNFAVYAATKSYVHSFSRALNQEHPCSEETDACPRRPGSGAGDRGLLPQTRKISVQRVDQKFRYRSKNHSAQRPYEGDAALEIGSQVSASRAELLL